MNYRLFINTWDELNHFTLQDKLKEWYNKYNKFTSIEHIFPKIKYSYWVPELRDIFSEQT